MTVAELAPADGPEQFSLMDAHLLSAGPWGESLRGLSAQNSAPTWQTAVATHDNGCFRGGSPFQQACFHLPHLAPTFWPENPPPCSILLSQAPCAASGQASSLDHRLILSEGRATGPQPPGWPGTY